MFVKKGICQALYAYDIGLSVDLAKCRKLVSALAPDSSIRHNRHVPKYFDYNPPPLLVTQTGESLKIGHFKTVPTVDILINDYGGVSISYTIPISGGLEVLRSLSMELHSGAELLRDSRKRVEKLLKLISPGVEKPEIASIDEDYAVYQIEEYDASCDTADLPRVFAQEFAQILRAETALLSEQEISDAMTCRISYEPNDVTLIDWNAAMIFDRDAEDIRLVLEFANIELLEVRLLDRQLDQSLDRSYQVLSKGTWHPFRGFRPSHDLRVISQMQMDGAVLFERVSNALKLLGDQYLARVYRLAAQRFHLAEWNSGILRKLEAIDSLYEKMNDRNATLRLEILEWIVIILIALEIVMPFMGKFSLGILGH
ncbi:MAG TPA: hypothetical protein DCZ95_07425 [Verrucomicrobia bacterium]|nr:hypothetical protein [Verrucomicrobiota bacterium]